MRRRLRAEHGGSAGVLHDVFASALLLIVVSVSGLVFGEYAARGEIQAQLQDLMGEQDAGAVQSLLASVRKPAEGLTATAVGLVLLFVGATTVFAELQNTLGRFAGGGMTLGVLFSAEFICVYALTFGSRSSG